MDFSDRIIYNICPIYKEQQRLVKNFPYILEENFFVIYLEKVVYSKHL